MHILILAFLLILPQPWQSMHTGQSWHTHGWQCIVTTKSPTYMQWGCIAPGRVNPSPPAPLAPSPAQVPASLAGEPCQARPQFPSHIILWQTPLGCYAGVYYMGYGDCFGWVHHLDPSIGAYRAHNFPRAGADVHIAPYNQGASSDGHWAKIVALSPDGHWALISEENMYWRGGGYNKVSFRYLYLNAGISYLW